jgi:hypothetical protein
MPDLIRRPEALEKTGFRLEFIPMEIGAGMTPFMKTVVYGQTLNNSCSLIMNMVSIFKFLVI